MVIAYAATLVWVEPVSSVDGGSIEATRASDEGKEQIRFDPSSCFRDFDTLMTYAPISYDPTSDEPVLSVGYSDPTDQSGGAITLILALYGDGRLVTGKLIPDFAPGPAVHPLVVAHLSDDAVQTTLQQARLLGLFADGKVFVGQGQHEQSVGIITTNTDDHTATISLRGDIGAHDGSLENLCVALFWQPLAYGPQNDGDEAFQLARWMPIDPVVSRNDYEIERLQVVVAAVEAPVAGYRVVDWPLPVPIHAFGEPLGASGYRCAVLAGPEIGLLFSDPYVRRSPSYWRDDGKSYWLSAQALYPGETGCRPAIEHR